MVYFWFLGWWFTFRFYNVCLLYFDHSWKHFVRTCSWTKIFTWCLNFILNKVVFLGWMEIYWFFFSLNFRCLYQRNLLIFHYDFWHRWRWRRTSIQYIKTACFNYSCTFLIWIILIFSISSILIWRYWRTVIWLIYSTL